MPRRSRRKKSPVQVAQEASGRAGTESFQIRKVQKGRSTSTDLSIYVLCAEMGSERQEALVLKWVVRRMQGTRSTASTLSVTLQCRSGTSAMSTALDGDCALTFLQPFQQQRKKR